MSLGTEQRRAGHYLTHPLALAMLGLWIVNDHVLKAALHNELTGKLSDIASLAFFPLLFVAAFELTGARLFREQSKRARAQALALVVGVVATGAVMVLINTTALGAEIYRVGLGAAQWPFVAVASLAGGGAVPPLHRVQLTVDPSDAFMLPALAIPLFIAWPRRPPGALPEG